MHHVDLCYWRRLALQASRLVRGSPLEADDRKYRVLPGSDLTLAYILRQNLKRWHHLLEAQELGH